MKMSDFILTIKKETDRMIEAWNNYGAVELKTSNLYNHMSNIELLICIFMCMFSKEQIVTSFNVDIPEDNSLYELVYLASFFVECRQLFYDDKIKLSIDAKNELFQSMLAVDSEIRNLPVPIELR